MQYDIRQFMVVVEYDLKQFLFVFRGNRLTAQD
jgi:hypothetical protein